MPPLPLPAKGKGGSCPSCPPSSGVPVCSCQRRLDSYSQSIMGNKLLITRAFSLTCWLSSSKHLSGKQDGRFWKSVATKGLRYFIKIALILKLLWSILQFLFGFLKFTVFKFNGLSCFLDFDGVLIDEGLIFPNITYFQKRNTSSKFHGLESPCIIHVKASTIFQVGLYFEKSIAF